MLSKSLVQTFYLFFNSVAIFEKRQTIPVELLLFNLMLLPAKLVVKTFFFLHEPHLSVIFFNYLKEAKGI